MARYRSLAGSARFHQTPFKPCVRFSRTRLNDDLLWCGLRRVSHGPAQSIQTHSMKLWPEPWRMFRRPLTASPVRGDIGLPSDQPVSLRETASLPAPRWIAAWFHPRPLLLYCCARASMLSTERHSCESGRTAHGIAVSYSAWRTPIACAGVLALYLLPGICPLPACPRAYLLTSPIKAGLLPSGALSCAPSLVLRAPRTPSRLRAISAVRPYTPGLCLTLAAR